MSGIRVESFTWATTSLSMRYLRRFSLTQGSGVTLKISMLSNRVVSLGSNCFWHEMDDATLTLGGYMWTYPGIQLTEKSICVMPESVSYSLEELVRCAGVCSDYLFQYQAMLENVGDENA